jgi:uncharacterized protein (DUF952 family)
MGFRLQPSAILRSDEPCVLERGKEHAFHTAGSRIFFEDVPIWHAKDDWTALAEIRVLSQSLTPDSVMGTFRVLHVYEGEEQLVQTAAFRRMFANEADPYIYLAMSPTDYAKASSAGTWAPDSLAGVGFIHASPASLLNRVLNKHYGHLEDVRIVALRIDLIRAEVRWEPATGGLYPHIYGALNMDAAERVLTSRKGPDGQHAITLSAG